MLQALLADRFKLVAHRETADHKVLALIVSKGGPKLKESTAKPEPIDPNAPLKPGEMTLDGPDGPIRMTMKSRRIDDFQHGREGHDDAEIRRTEPDLHLDSSMVTMAGFADTLSAIMTQMGGRQVVDMTGLKGNYEVSVEIALADLMTLARSQGFVRRPRRRRARQAPGRLWPPIPAEARAFTNR